MGFQESTGYCDACDQQVMVRRKTANHILHFLITVVLGIVTAPFFFIGGVFWALIWLLSTIQIGGWRCTNCGRKAWRGDQSGAMTAESNYKEMWENVAGNPSIKFCPACGRKNRKEDYTCIGCGKSI